MKKKIILLILTILLILIMINLVLRREKIVKIDEIEERIEISKTEGVIKNFYKKRKNEPFTGKIVKDFENDGISFEFNVKNGKKMEFLSRIIIQKKYKLKRFIKMENLMEIQQFIIGADKFKVREPTKRVFL